MEVVLAGVDIEYPEAVVRSGGVPILLPSVTDIEGVRSILALVDGVLLTGGEDIHAQAYGEEPHEESKLHDPGRDRMEFEVALTAMKRNMPVLGICRGLQLLNVVQGGTLYQDIPSQMPEAIRHHYMDEDEFALHDIAIEDETLLAHVMGKNTMPVNSWHHQAVKVLGKGLRINAHAPDGVVEGIESTEGKPVLAVQCHPEECLGDFPCYRELFDWLISEARAYRERQ